MNLTEDYITNGNLSSICIYKKKKRTRTNYRFPENAARLRTAVSYLLHQNQNETSKDFREVARMFSLPYNTLRDNYLKSTTGQLIIGKREKRQKIDTVSTVETSTVNSFTQIIDKHTVNEVSDTFVNYVMTSLPVEAQRHSHQEKTVNSSPELQKQAQCLSINDICNLTFSSSSSSTSFPSCSASPLSSNCCCKHLRVIAVPPAPAGANYVLRLEKCDNSNGNNISNDILAVSSAVSSVAKTVTNCGAIQLCSSTTTTLLPASTSTIPPSSFSLPAPSTATTAVEEVSSTTEMSSSLILLVPSTMMTTLAQHSSNLINSNDSAQIQLQPHHCLLHLLPIETSSSSSSSAAEQSVIHSTASASSNHSYCCCCCGVKYPAAVV